MVLLALLGVAGFNTLVYTGLQSTTATNSVLIQSTMPIQILLLNGLLFGTRVQVRELASILLSLAGVVWIVARGDPTTLWQGEWNTGDAWIIAAALTWAGYSVLLRWRPPGLSAAAFLGFTLPVGWLALTPLYLAESWLGRPVTWDLTVALTVAYVAVFPSVLAFLFWNRGVAAIGANAAGHFIHLLPVFGTGLAVLFLGERLEAYHVLGAGLVGIGIGLTLVRARR
jgi:drug/metabolite transporter (DMT)-like permease